MARYMHAGQTTAYRAVIKETYDGGSSTYYRGPYATKAAASQAISRAKRTGYRWRVAEVTGHVEESPFVWQPFSNEPGAGKFHTDSTGTRFVNTGDGSPQPWVRLGPVDDGFQWYAWEAIRDR